MSHSTFQISTTLRTSPYAMGGVINVGGNVDVTGYGNASLTNVRLVGSSNQTVTSVSTAHIPSLEIASTGGTVTLAGYIKTVSNFVYTSGTVSATGSTYEFTLFGVGAWSGTRSLSPGTVHFNDVVLSGNSNNINSRTLTGTLYVDGALTFGGLSGNEGILSGGSINVVGNITANASGLTGTTLIRAVGSSSQTITGGGGTVEFPALKIASTGGTVTLSGTLLLYSHFTYTSGTVNAGTSTLQFYINGTGASATITPGSVMYNNVTFAANSGDGTRSAEHLKSEVC